MKRIVVIFLVTLLLIPAPAMANDSLKISNLEKRVKVLEAGRARQQVFKMCSKGRG